MPLAIHQEEPNEFQTKNIYLAATLSILDFPVLKTHEDTKTGLTYWHFKDTELLRMTVEQFRAKELSVEPNRLVSEIRLMRSIIGESTTT